MCDSLWLVDFAILRADSVFHLPNNKGRLKGKLFEEIQITEVL